MTLDPQLRGSWRDMMGILRPPPGYRLEAAVGTTFGLGFDALVAAMLAMLGADSDALHSDPLSALIAATRLSPRMRVLVQAGSVSGAVTGIPTRLACLLDRVVVSVKPDAGLFHPKLWVVRYRYQGSDNESPDLVRVLVGSRNLTASSAFEMGALLEGEVEKDPHDLGKSISRVLAENLRLGRFRSQHISNLTGVLSRTRFRHPDAGRAITQLHWQGPGGKGHHRLLPKEAERALVISPFLSATFLHEVMRRTRYLRVVSTPGAFRQLDDATFVALQERGAQQSAPCMYVVADECEREDEGKFEGLHAKAVLFDEGKDTEAVTYLGSANATAAGWALGTTGNAETLIELRPGLGMDRLLRDFVVDKKGEPRPWIREYHAEDRTPLSDDEMLQDRMRGVLQQAAASAFRVSYSRDDQTLTLGMSPGSSLPPLQVVGRDVVIECLPLALQEQERPWTDLAAVAAAPVEFPKVELCDVTAFVVLRTTFSGVTLARIAVAELDLPETMLEDRDNAARQDILAQLSAEDVLSALILGLARVRAHDRRASTNEATHHHGASTRALQQVTIERTLQAVAQNPELIRELRLLLPADADAAFMRFREDLEAVLETSAQGRR